MKRHMLPFPPLSGGGRVINRDRTYKIVESSPYLYFTQYSTQYEAYFYLKIVCFSFPGGVHTDLGDPVRLPVPQVVRRHRQIRQGVRPRRLGTRQPGQLGYSTIITAECEFDSTFYHRSGVVCFDISRHILHLSFLRITVFPG